MSNPGPAITSSIHPSNLSTVQAERLLCGLKGVSVGAAADFKLPIVNSSTYSVQQIVVTNAQTPSTGASADVHTVYFGLYTAPGGASGNGTAIYTAAALSGVTANTVVDVLTPTTTASQTVQNLYVNISTAFVAGATVDVYVYGYDLS
jgi:hypothetical protein